MKIITLYQPWATLVAIKAKKIDTRSWGTKYRGPLGIHASVERKYIDMRSKHYVCDKEPFYSILMNLNLDMPLPRGFILATCNLTGCLPIHEGRPLPISNQEKAFGDYTPGRFMWLFDEVEELESPILAKGKQGLWEWKNS